MKHIFYQSLFFFALYVGTAEENHGKNGLKKHGKLL